MSRKKRKIRFFFIKSDDKLHLNRVLHVNKPEDMVTAWDYTDHKRKVFVWSDVRRRMQNAYSIKETAEILGKSKMTVEGYIREGQIRTPQRIYALNESRTPGKFMLSEDDVLDLHQAMSERHQGRPRKDGLVTNNGLPTRAEVRTLVQQGDVLYTRDDKGNFIPIWKEQVW